MSDKPRRPIASYAPGEWNALLAGFPPPTDDEVSLTWDGRKLDTAEKVRAFIAEVEAMKAEEATLSDDERAERRAKREAVRLAHGYDGR